MADKHVSGTKYWEIKRESATQVTWTRYNDSDYTDPFDSKTLTDVSSSTDGLRYFKVANFQSGSGSASLDGSLDDLVIYNGVSQVYANENIILEESYRGNHASTFGTSSSSSNPSATSVEKYRGGNDVAHFEGTVGAGFVIGQQITSGNNLIGNTITDLSFYLYKLSTGSSNCDTETFTIGVWAVSYTHLKLPPPPYE